MLHSQEDIHQVIINKSADCIKVLDLEGKILSMNKGGMQAMEIDDLSQCLHTAWLDFWDGAGRDAAFQALTDARAGKVGTFQGFAATAKGTPKWWDVVVTPLFDGNGTVEQLLSISRDITEQKHLEQERERLLQERTALLELTDEGFYGIDVQGRCTFVNKAGAQMLGYSAEELLGKNMHFLIHHSHADGSPYAEQDCPIFRAIKSEQGGRLDADVFWRKDGSCFPTEYSSYPLRDNGTLRGAVVAFMDITQRKELEQQKDAFLSITSHELRTPLTTIKANIQLTQLSLKKLRQEEELSKKGGELIERVSDFLERALRQTSVQQRLISDLLDVSRIQMNKLELSLEVCDLVTIVRETVKDQQHGEAASRLHVVLPAQKSILVMADEKRLSQVVNNYVTNALKYSRSDQPIHVGIEEEEQVARVWVRDSGPGLTPEQQQHIWERFYQAPGVPVQSGAGVGLGLGLHICHILIERHGGNVGVESTRGGGSTFWFTIPLLST